MISWMQKKKKYLIVTIWVSTIAFVGAGFVGWGQYSYGDKASAVAKVGEVDVSMGEFQKSYSNLYAQYAQMFGGEFDEERANSFGLKSQALDFLINQALVLNLAKHFDIDVSDVEIANDIKTKDYFFLDGKFDKATYEDILSRNNITKKEYEQSVKKELTITKLLSLMDVKANENEQAIVDFALGIADKIEYKVLDPKSIEVAVDETKLHAFWEENKNNFLSEPSYEIEYIKVPVALKEFSQDELQEYYDDNKESLKDGDGKIKSFEDAKDEVVAALSSKEAKNTALRAYIAFKKGEDSGYEVQKTNISQSNNIFDDEILGEILALKDSSDILKPVEFESNFYSIKLLKTIESMPKSFEDAKDEVSELFVQNEQENKIKTLAKNSYESFSGETTDFINHSNASSLKNLSDFQKEEFLNSLFISHKANDFITLSDGSVVLYRILEQKVLNNTNKDISMLELKNRLFNEGLVRDLKSRFKIETFIKEGI